MARKNSWALQLALLALLACSSLVHAAAKAAATAKVQEQFVLNGEKWMVTQDPSRGGRTYFFNTQTRQSQWQDPRKDPTTEHMVAVMSLLLPLVLVVLVGAAYIFYVKKFMPEKLKVQESRKGTKAWTRMKVGTKAAAAGKNSGAAAAPDATAATEAETKKHS